MLGAGATEPQPAMNEGSMKTPSRLHMVNARVVNGAHIDFPPPCLQAFPAASGSFPRSRRPVKYNRNSQINRGAHPRAAAKADNIPGTSTHYTFEEFH